LGNSGSLQIQTYSKPQKVIYPIFLPQGQLSYLRPSGRHMIVKHFIKTIDGGNSTGSASNNSSVSPPQQLESFSLWFV